MYDIYMGQHSRVISPFKKILTLHVLMKHGPRVTSHEMPRRGVKGPFINFTVTFSYAICPVCPNNQGLPATCFNENHRDGIHQSTVWPKKATCHLTKQLLVKYSRSVRCATSSLLLYIVTLWYAYWCLWFLPWFAGAMSNAFHTPGNWNSWKFGVSLDSQEVAPC